MDNTIPDKANLQTQHQIVQYKTTNTISTTNTQHETPKPHTTNTQKTPTT